LTPNGAIDTDRPQRTDAALLSVERSTRKHWIRSDDLAEPASDDTTPIIFSDAVVLSTVQALRLSGWQVPALTQSHERIIGDFAWACRNCSTGPLASAFRGSALQLRDLQFAIVLAAHLLVSRVVFCRRKKLAPGFVLRSSQTGGFLPLQRLKTGATVPRE